jgi:hypothetical protein
MYFLSLVRFSPCVRMSEVFKYLWMLRGLWTHRSAWKCIYIRTHTGLTSGRRVLFHSAIIFCRWMKFETDNWCSNTDGKILRARIRPCSSAIYPPHIQHTLAWDQTQACGESIATISELDWTFTPLGLELNYGCTLQKPGIWMAAITFDVLGDICMWL